MVQGQPRDSRPLNTNQGPARALGDLQWSPHAIDPAAEAAAAGPEPGDETATAFLEPG